MAISLVKGGNISLSDAAPGLKSISVALGWDPRQTTGEDFDLDASAFLLNEKGKVSRDEDFIFYGNLESQCGSVMHGGDDLKGETGEIIKVNLEMVPVQVQKISFTVTIYEADKRRQNFGMVSNAFIRVENAEDDLEIARFDLAEDMSTETAMIFGEVYRYKGAWKFRAVGQGYAGGLAALCRNYGVDVADD